MDPFVLLGVPLTMDLDERELERRYLERSRESHPDYHRDASPEQQLAVLDDSARLNDAYRTLRDPWTRAEAILRLRDPNVLERTKQLCPIFLSEAMELAEEVATAAEDRRDQLLARVRAGVDGYLAKIREEIMRGNWERAATLLHEARYHRKALADLEARR